MVGKREPTVIAATDPGVSVAGLLSGDITDTRAWVAKVLGDLTGDDENDARLRETLRVFLGCGSSDKVAAEELNLHFNTVKYRVGRAVARARQRDRQGPARRRTRVAGLPLVRPRRSASRFAT
jgi:sugar diacid utilization regulator